jgi:hypothetical protein
MGFLLFLSKKVRNITIPDALQWRRRRALLEASGLHSSPKKLGSPGQLGCEPLVR